MSIHSSDFFFKLATKRKAHFRFQGQQRQSLKYFKNCKHISVKTKICKT